MTAALFLGGGIAQLHFCPEVHSIVSCLCLQIRVAAYEALMSLLDSIPSDQRRQRVLPVLRQHLQPFNLDIIMQRCVARHFGLLLAGVGTIYSQAKTLVGTLAWGMRCLARLNTSCGHACFHACRTWRMLSFIYVPKSHDAKCKQSSVSALFPWFSELSLPLSAFLHSFLLSCRQRRSKSEKMWCL